MNRKYSKEVAAYLNNKFGDDFTETEPYPYWMREPDQEETCDIEENNEMLKYVVK